jgi:hypothetical protein
MRLGHIISLFDDVEKISRSVSAKDDEQEDLGSSASIHRSILEICHRRQKHTSKAKKAKWALYKREDLNDLVKNLQSLVNDLIELFPAAAVQLRDLCDEEAEELSNEAALPLLKTVAQELDLPLAEAIDRLEKRSVGVSTLERVSVW